MNTLVNGTLVRILSIFALCTSLLFFRLPLAAQAWEWGIGLGGTVYDGELSPDHFVGRLELIDPAISAHVRYRMSPFWSVRLQVLKSSFRGDDAYNRSEARRRRNLSVRTALHEVALLGEFSYPIFERETHDRYFAVYAFTGIAFFHFNPTTVYLGEIVDLQPLGTEGQGLAIYPDRQPYKLWQWAIPFGGGVQIGLHERLSMYIEMGGRKTFTDYLDDVSTTYVPYDVLLEHRGELSAALANRMGEFQGTGPVRLPEGTRRGSPGARDWYLTGALGFVYSF